MAVTAGPYHLPVRLVERVSLEAPVGEGVLARIKRSTSAEIRRLSLSGVPVFPSSQIYISLRPREGVREGV